MDIETIIKDSIEAFDLTKDQVIGGLSSVLQDLDNIANPNSPVCDEADVYGMVREHFRSLGSKEKERKPMQRRVVCAAMRKDGILICGARHFDQVMRDQVKLIGLPSVSWEQGFIDQKGVFLTREEAWIIAKDADQIIRIVSSEGTLYSENLY